jgi:hypothetical protein
MKKDNTKRKIIYGFILCSIVLLGSGLIYRTYDYLSLTKISMEVVNTLQNGEVQELLCNNTLSPETKKIYEEMTGEKLEENNGGYEFINNILIHSKVSGKVAILQNKISYTVEAPDMNKCIKKLLETKKIDDYRSIFLDYIQDGDRIKQTYDMDYTKENGKWKADYRNPDFISTITGNFNEAYTGLYNELIQYYKEFGGEESE